MVNNNRLSAIWHWLARSTRYAGYVDMEDLQSFDRRFRAEGLAFGARGLSALRIAFLSGLETGWLDISEAALRFGPKRGSVLPRFLFRTFSLVFTPEGKLRDDYDVGAIDALNTLLGVFGKIEGGHTPESEVQVVESFKSTERELRRFVMIDYPAHKLQSQVVDNLGSARFQKIVDSAAMLVRRVLAGVDPSAITPKHGSGVSACGTLFHCRFARPRFVRKIDRLWPYEEFWTCGPSHLSDEAEPYDMAPYDPQAKVLLVPKDCRGPRLISCEPRETMWVQQGLMHLIVDACERRRRTRGEVNFTDQTVNQVLAHAGSMTGSHFAHQSGMPVPTSVNTGSWATLDLKDASDRVSMALVRDLFPRKWVEALTAVRSATTKLPDGGIVSMVKHAPMGSAVCFPVMALCIWSIVKSAIHHVAGAQAPVYVYGDDVVCAPEYRKIATEALRLAGLMVNERKSFSQGPFRESCGGEYVDGIDVTPVRLRAIPNTDALSKLKTISFYNNCCRKFSSFECDELFGLLNMWYGSIATSSSEAALPDFVQARTGKTRVLTGVAIRDNPDNSKVRRRWNKNLQRFEFRVPYAVSRETVYPTDAWSHVFRSLVQPPGGTVTINDDGIKSEGLGRDALAKRVRIKYGWAWLGA